jgi:hypothetical protein
MDMVIVLLHVGMAGCMFIAGFSVAKLLDRPKRDSKGRYVKK